VDAAPRTLREAGVYVPFEELKLKRGADELA